MLRALDLAYKAVGMVSPNPMVGAVIVDSQGDVIGEGYHPKCGDSHAEVKALESVSDKSRIAGSTVYVTLEPCSHFGKTPPCADRLIAERVGRVVVGCVDPNPKVSGRGIEKLKAAGIRVEVGVLEDLCREVNKRFITAQTLNRPYIILKWAQTSDGFLDANRPSNIPPAWFTGPNAKALVHRWRTEEDAILVGRVTAQNDNPSLTVREYEGRNPVRIVLTSSGRLDETLNVFDGESITLIVSSSALSYRNAETIVLDRDNFTLKDILDALLSRGIQSIIVEGGAMVLNSFLREGLWDEVRLFTTDYPLSHYYPTLNIEQLFTGAKAPRMEDYQDQCRRVESSFLSEDSSVNLIYYYNVTPH